MTKQNISAKVTKGDRAGIVFNATVELPETIQEAVDSWGEEITYNRLMASIVIDIQATMRGAINKDGATEESVAASAAGWRPEARARGMSPAEKIQSLLAKLTPEERAEVLGEFA